MATTQAAEAGAAHGPAAGAPAGLGGSSLGGSAQRRGRHAAKLSFSDLMAGEGLLGRPAGDAGPDAAAGGAGAEQLAAAAGQEGGAEAQQAQQAAQAAQQAQQSQQAQAAEEMVLLDAVPQQAYARIKLCRLGVWAAGGCGCRAAAATRRACRGTPGTVAGAHDSDVPQDWWRAGPTERCGAASQRPLAAQLVPSSHPALRCPCRTVLRDHIIPAYLPALQNAVAGMRRQAGLPEREAEGSAAAAGGEGAVEQRAAAAAAGPA